MQFSHSALSRLAQLAVGTLAAHQSGNSGTVSASSTDYSHLLDMARAAAHGPSFAGLEPEFSKFESAAIAVLPVPYDRTSTYNKGSDRGPAALLTASTQVELYDIETDTEVYEQGIATLAPLVVDGSPEELFTAVRDATAWILHQKKFPVIIGGEHSITPGIVCSVERTLSDIVHPSGRDGTEKESGNSTDILTGCSSGIL